MTFQEEQLKKAHSLVFKLLARREYSQQELTQKLAQKDYPKNIIDTVLAELTAQNMQSDYRVAEMLLSHGYKSGWGPNKIKAQMQAKGLEYHIIEQVFATIDCSGHENSWQNAKGDTLLDNLASLNKEDKIQNLQNLISDMSKMSPLSTNMHHEHGISLNEYDSAVGITVASIDFSGINWNQLAIQVAEKKFGAALASLSNNDNNTWEFKAKVQRFLYNKGFEAEHINYTIKKYNLEYS